MTHWLGCTAALLLSCSCVTPMANDSGIDAGAPVDAGGEDASEALPEVDPAARPCEGHPAPAGATCIEGGWFLMSRWTTAVLVDGGVHRRPLEPTYLDSFSLDVTEVSRGAYLDFVRSGDAGVLPPPPDCGGYMNVDDRYPEIGFSMRAERSGWTDAGVPVPGSESAPVACVTRAEAVAFCAHRGGRLPTAFEFFRAVRGAFPSGRRLPWGDTPPALTGLTPSSTTRASTRRSGSGVRAGRPTSALVFAGRLTPVCWISREASRSFSTSAPKSSISIPLTAASPSGRPEPASRPGARRAPWWLETTGTRPAERCR